MALAIAGGPGAWCALLTAGALGAAFFKTESRPGAPLGGPGALSVERERDRLLEAQAFSHVGSWEADLLTGFGPWSPEMYRICGLEPPARIGRDEDILKTVFPQDRRKLMQVIERASRDLEPFEFAHRVVWPDGTVRFCVSRGKVFGAKAPEGEGPAPQRLVAVTQDISQQARTEESLRDAEARFLAFMDHSPFSAWMRAADGQFAYCNERMASHMGLQPHELVVPGHQESFLSDEYIERSRLDDQQVLEQGRPTENIEHVLLRDGSARHWLVLKFPIRSESGI